MKKILIKEKHDEISLGSLEGSIELAIGYFQSIRKSIPSDMEISISVETEYGYYDGDRDYQKLAIYISRLETDEEYEKRMSLDKKARINKLQEKVTKEEAEYDTYLKLKEKFDGR